MSPKDPRFEQKSPRSADDQPDGPEPERPVPPEEIAREDGQPDKPSQAEGEREEDG